MKKNNTKVSLFYIMNALIIIMLSLNFYNFWLLIYGETVYFYHNGNLLLTFVFLIRTSIHEEPELLIF